jgi:hypothetical protein
MEVGTTRSPVGAVTAADSNSWTVVAAEGCSDS